MKLQYIMHMLVAGAAEVVFLFAVLYVNQRRQSAVDHFHAVHSQ